MLFGEESLHPELTRSMKSLETALPELGVPWPFDETADMALLTRIKARYPDMNVGDLVDDFLIWCVDARPWENDKGKPVVVRWKSRLWTRARNEVTYAKKKKMGRTTTHYAPTEGHNKDEVLDEW